MGAPARAAGAPVAAAAPAEPDAGAPPASAGTCVHPEPSPELSPPAPSSLDEPRGGACAPPCPADTAATAVSVGHAKPASANAQASAIVAAGLDTTRHAKSASTLISR